MQLSACVTADRFSLLNHIFVSTHNLNLLPLFFLFIYRLSRSGYLRAYIEVNIDLISGGYYLWEVFSIGWGVLFGEL